MINISYTITVLNHLKEHSN